MLIPKFIIAPDKKNITIEHIFLADLPKVWHAWTSVERLVKWWGPADWPASNKSFDFRAGGHWHYCMTGPDGTKAWGWMEYTHIDEGQGFSFDDYFCDEDGVKNSGLPSARWKVLFGEITPGRTSVTIVLSFETESELQKIVEMGFEPGFTSALYNLEELLSSSPFTDGQY